MLYRLAIVSNLEKEMIIVPGRPRENYVLADIGLSSIW